MRASSLHRHQKRHLHRKGSGVRHREDRETSLGNIRLARPRIWDLHRRDRPRSVLKDRVQANILHRHQRRNLHRRELHLRRRDLHRSHKRKRHRVRGPNQSLRSEAKNKGKKAKSTCSRKRPQGSDKGGTAEEYNNLHQIQKHTDQSNNKTKAGHQEAEAKTHRNNRVRRGRTVGGGQRSRVQTRRNNRTRGARKSAGGVEEQGRASDSHTASCAGWDPHKTTQDRRSRENRKSPSRRKRGPLCGPNPPRSV